MATMTTRVTPAVTGAAAGDASAGTSVNLPRMIGATEIGISISTVGPPRSA